MNTRTRGVNTRIRVMREVPSISAVVASAFRRTEGEPEPEPSSENAAA